MTGTAHPTFSTALNSLPNQVVNVIDSLEADGPIAFESILAVLCSPDYHPPSRQIMLYY